MTKPRKHIPNNSRKGEARRGKASSTKSSKAEVKHISDKECRTTTLKRKLYFKERSTTI